MLNICIVFAQLERETIQKRVADAYFSRSRKSLYMGGRVPYGYRLSPAVIGGVRSSRYEAVPEEAEVLRLIFARYAQPECSYGDIVRELQARGIDKRGRPWERARVAELLRSPVYVRADLSIYRFYQNQGVEIVNDPADFIGTNGCYYYKGNGTGQLVLAPHEGIIPAEIWLQCRGKCRDVRQIQPCQKAKNTWLAGKIKCGLCGYALMAKRPSGASHSYLLCSRRMGTKDCPGPGTIHTEELEELVWNAMEKKLTLFPQLHPRAQTAADPERTALQLELTRLDREITGLMDRLAAADGVLIRYIQQRVTELDGRKQAVQQKLDRSGPGRGSEGPALTGYAVRWRQLSFDHKRQAADLLIQAIRVEHERILIQWRV